MDIYERNLIALENYHSGLVETIKSTEIKDDKLKILETESGDHRVLYKKDGGEEVYIHNAHDPAKCANEAIDLLGKMGKEGIVALFGFGLGYFAEELIKRFEKGHMMVIYEATPEIFKAALMTRDISGLLEHEKVNISLGDGGTSFSFFEKHQHLIANGKFWIVKHHPSVKLNNEGYDKFEKRLIEERLLTTSRIATTIGLGKEFINAFMANIPHIMRKAGVEKLKDMFKGRPSIVVAAGPSLEKNIHLLKKAKGKAIIVAVDASLPTLLPAGIVPDILVAVDPEDANIVFFKDNLLLKEVPFICLAQYAPNILDIYPGPVFINTSPGNIIFQLFCSFWENKGFIEYFGGSVAHLAFAVAEYIGSDVIALVGQDLSYEKNMHAGDVGKLLHEHNNPGEEFPEFKPGEIETKNIFGEKRYTNHSFRAFRISFERKIKTFNGTVVHASEDGVPLEGANVMRLSDFIGKYCNLPELNTFLLLSNMADAEVSYNLDGLTEATNGIRDQFLEIKKNAEKILKHIYRVVKLQKNGKNDCQELHNILEKIEQLSEKVKHPILSVITQYNYKLELYLKQQDVLDIDDIEDKWERLEKQLVRGERYYEEVINEIDLFCKQLSRLKKGLKRENSVNTILMDKNKPDNERYRKIGNIYNASKKSVQAAKYLELALKTTKNSKSDNPNEKESQLYSLKISLVKTYLEQFRYYEAKELLLKVKGSKITKDMSAKRKSNNFKTNVNELLEVCDKKINEWNEREKKMINLTEKADANYGGFLESGNFYLNSKEFAMAEEVFLRAIRECEENIIKRKSVSNGQEQKERLPHSDVSQNKKVSKLTINGQPSIVNSKSSIVNAYYGLANLYIAMEKPEKSVEALGKAMEIAPDNPKIYCDLGRFAFQNNNINESEIFFKKAIELAPNEEAPYKLLSDLYLKLGELEKATLLYENAIFLNPGNPVFLKKLTEIYRMSIRKKM